jgi:hypothetical protein
VRNETGQSSHITFTTNNYNYTQAAALLSLSFSRPLPSPVTLKVLPAEQSVRVRSHMPGSVAMRTWGTPSYVRFSYTSSETTTTCERECVYVVPRWLVCGVVSCRRRLKHLWRGCDFMPQPVIAVLTLGCRWTMAAILSSSSRRNTCVTIAYTYPRVMRVMYGEQVFSHAARV